VILWQFSRVAGWPCASSLNSFGARPFPALALLRLQIVSSLFHLILLGEGGRSYAGSRSRVASEVAYSSGSVFIICGHCYAQVCAKYWTSFEIMFPSFSGLQLAPQLCAHCQAIVNVFNSFGYWIFERQKNENTYICVRRSTCIQKSTKAVYDGYVPWLNFIRRL
jgi:hypothetical protein